MNNNFKNKYFKYKKKYLELKYGGADPSFFDDILESIDTTLDPNALDAERHEDELYNADKEIRNTYPKFEESTNNQNIFKPEEIQQSLQQEQQDQLTSQQEQQQQQQQHEQQHQQYPKQQQQHEQQQQQYPKQQQQQQHEQQQRPSSQQEQQHKQYPKQQQQRMEALKLKVNKIRLRTFIQTNLNSSATPEALLKRYDETINKNITKDINRPINISPEIIKKIKEKNEKDKKNIKQLFNEELLNNKEIIDVDGDGNCGIYSIQGLFFVNNLDIKLNVDEWRDTISNFGDKHPEIIKFDSENENEISKIKNPNTWLDHLSFTIICTIYKLKINYISEQWEKGKKIGYWKSFFFPVDANENDDNITELQGGLYYKGGSHWQYYILK